MRTDLARFFSPRSIAIIGASQNLISISGQPLKHLVAHQYAGKLYPVNPKYQEVLGVKCYPSLAALPETLDALVGGSLGLMLEPLADAILALLETDAAATALRNASGGSNCT